MTTYSILLYQTTGEVHAQWTSESREVIMKHWEDQKNQQDEFTKYAQELVLYEDEEVIDNYVMIDAQREWIAID